MARRSHTWLFIVLPLGAVVLAVIFVITPPTRLETKAFRIPSGSMEPTLLIGDFIFVSILPEYVPRRGDLVVYESVEEDGLKALKRVMGLPGDTLVMMDDRLSVNGQALEEPYLASPPAQSRDDEVMLQRMASWQQPFLVRADTAYHPNGATWGPLIVPADAYFLLGDNRHASYDSRYWGFLPANHVLGKPRSIYYSYDPLSYHLLPALTAIRWGRIGHRFP
jgi:signal peptidase I